MDPMQKPQNTDQQALPVQPVVSGSANQTNARTGMVAPDLPPAAASDQAWAARVAQNNTLNPPTGPAPASSPAQQLFSRALPANGAPTPTFAPVDHAKAGLAALLGLTPDHAAQGQALAAAGAPPTPPPAAPVPTDNPAMSGPRYATGPTTVQDGQQRLAAYPNWSREAAAMQHGLDPNHPGVKGTSAATSRDQYIAAMRGTPRSVFQKMQELEKIPSMTDQAKSVGAQLQPTPNAFADYITKIAQAAQYPVDQAMGASGAGAVAPY